MHKHMPERTDTHSYKCVSDPALTLVRVVVSKIRRVVITTRQGSASFDWQGKIVRKAELSFSHSVAHISILI